MEATAQAARRIGGFYNQVAEAVSTVGRQFGSMLSSSIQDAGNVAVKYQDHQQISHGAATASEMFVNLENAWNDAKKGADPNDQSVAAKFRDTVLGPALDKFSENFTTENSQKFAEGVVDRYRQHFAVKTAADMSTLGGIAAKENATKTINSLSSAVYLDPSSLDTAIDTLKHSAGHIVDSSPTIDAETGARVKAELNQKGIESLVKSAVSGMIQKNPNIDLDAIQRKYGDYVSGAELKTFQKAAQTQQKVDFLQNKAIEREKEQQGNQAVHVGANKVMTDNIKIDPQTNRPVIKPDFFQQSLDLVRKNQDAPNAAATARTLLDWGEHQQNLKDEIVRTDPATRRDLIDRMFSADKPTTDIDIMRAEADRKLSRTDAQPLLALNKALTQEPLHDPVWHDTIAAVKGELVLSNVGIPGKDIAGEGNYAKWAQTFIPQYLSMKRAGTLPPNALDVKDPTSLISQSMAPFKRTIQQRATDYTATLGGMSDAAAPPTVTTKAQFDALKSGTTYIGTDGKSYRKP